MDCIEIITKGKGWKGGWRDIFSWHDVGYK